MKFIILSFILINSQEIDIFRNKTLYYNCKFEEKKYNFLVNSGISCLQNLLNPFELNTFLKRNTPQNIRNQIRQLDSNFHGKSN